MVRGSKSILKWNFQESLSTPNSLPKTLWGNLGALQHQVPYNQTFSQQKWRPSPSTIIQIYKQCRPSNFWTWLSFNHNNIGHNHQQNSKANKFIRLALRLPKYISVKLLHVLIPITNLTSRNAKLFQNNFETLRPHLFSSRDLFTCSHIYFWRSKCDSN